MEVASEGLVLGNSWCRSFETENVKGVWAGWFWGDSLQIPGLTGLWLQFEKVPEKGWSSHECCESQKNINNDTVVVTHKGYYL